MALIDSVISDRVLIVRIDNRRANIINTEMANSLKDIAINAGTRSDVGALLITGAHGRNFCGGSDIKELTVLHEEGKGAGPLLEAEMAAFNAIADLNIPTIAAIDGAAAGGGLELAICCDLIVASEIATFSLPEIKLGVFAALGGTVRLPERIGYSRTLELLLLGNDIDAATALQWGLVNKLTRERYAFAEARTMAKTLANGARQSPIAIKTAIRASKRLSEKKALEFALNLAKKQSASLEVSEGLRAFNAKEEPDFASLYETVPKD